MRYKLHLNKTKRLIITIIVLLLLSLYIFRYIDKNIRPSVIAISEVRAKQVTTQTINNTINEKIKKDINYNDLIFIKYDNEGKVTLMQANTILMNNIASEVALEVQKELKKISESTIKVPMTNAFNTQLVNLPSLNVEIVPQGSVNVDYATEFESTGINQTRHRIYIIINTDIRMIVPLRSQDIRITTNIPIAETIIVGTVPEQFVNVPEDGILDIVD